MPATLMLVSIVTFLLALGVVDGPLKIATSPLVGALPPTQFAPLLQFSSRPGTVPNYVGGDNGTREIKNCYRDYYQATDQQQVSSKSSFESCANKTFNWKPGTGNREPGTEDGESCRCLSKCNGV